MYKPLLLLFLIFSLSCKKEDQITIEDECPSCTSLIKINGLDWPSKPQYAYYQSKSMDTFFTIGIQEVNPAHDHFGDYLDFWRIPYQEGLYPFDSISHFVMNRHAAFDVYESGYDAATRTYEPLYNGESTVSVDSIDKMTGYVKISFDLLLYPFGSPSIPPNNSTYSTQIEIHGQANGILKVD